MRPKQRRWIARARSLVPARWLAKDRLGDRRLWIATEITVARGVAIGLFFGLLLPFGQIVAALPLAAVVRANLAAAVLSTFVTNPLTMPLFYAAGYQLGRTLLNHPVAGDLPGLADGASGTIASLVLGQVLLAAAGALTGFALVRFGWRWWRSWTTTGLGTRKDQ